MGHAHRQMEWTKVALGLNPLDQPAQSPEVGSRGLGIVAPGGDRHQPLAPQVGRRLKGPQQFAQSLGRRTKFAFLTRDIELKQNGLNHVPSVGLLLECLHEPDTVDRVDEGEPSDNGCRFIALEMADKVPDWRRFPARQRIDLRQGILEPVLAEGALTRLHRGNHILGWEGLGDGDQCDGRRVPPQPCATRRMRLRICSNRAAMVVGVIAERPLPRRQASGPHEMFAGASKPLLGFAQSGQDRRTGGEAVCRRLSMTSSTPPRTKITALLPTCNEQANIADCIASVQWADEVFVVDSFSDDSTPELARSAGARVVQHEYVNSATQKNWSIPQCTHPWVLIVDSDERVTPELRDEILGILEADARKDAAPPMDGYRVWRLNHFLGRRVRYCGWQNDRCLRLFRRDLGRYQDRQVHADVMISSGRVGRLRGRLLHYTFTSFDQYMRKFDRYTTQAAGDRAQTTETVRWYHLTLRPAGRFLKQYLLKLGFLDGMTGLVLCQLAAFSVFLKYAKLYELRRGQPNASGTSSAVRTDDVTEHTSGTGLEPSQRRSS